MRIKFIIPVFIFMAVLFGRTLDAVAAVPLPDVCKTHQITDIISGKIYACMDGVFCGDMQPQTNYSIAQMAPTVAYCRDGWKIMTKLCSDAVKDRFDPNIMKYEWRGEDSKRCWGVLCTNGYEKKLTMTGQKCVKADDVDKSTRPIIDDGALLDITNMTTYYCNWMGGQNDMGPCFQHTKGADQKCVNLTNAAGNIETKVRYAAGKYALCRAGNAFQNDYWEFFDDADAAPVAEPKTPEVPTVQKPLTPANHVKTADSSEKKSVVLPQQKTEQKTEQNNDPIIDNRNPCERGDAGFVLYNGQCITTAERDAAETELRNAALVAQINAKTSEINLLYNKYANMERNVWRNESGNFNTSRLASDAIAGAVLGTAGGLITHHVIKKNQTKTGFEDIKCSVAGEVMADYGDEFIMEK